MLNLLIVSVNYNDYLIHTLHYNKFVFDNIYIVSSERDKEISQIIDRENTNSNIHLLRTEVFFEDGAWGKTIFNKGGGLNYGLSQMPHEGWILIGDADCIYPNKLRPLLPLLNSNNLYCMNRHIVKTPKAIPIMVNLMNGTNIPPTLLEEFKKPRHTKIRKHFPGYCQLFNFGSVVFHNRPPQYPEGRSCRHVDSMFSRSAFGRYTKYKTVLNQYFCLHLGETCLNWYGRKSDKFL